MRNAGARRKDDGAEPLAAAPRGEPQQKEVARTGYESVTEIGGGGTGGSGRGNPGGMRRGRSFWWRHQWIFWLAAALLAVVAGLSVVLGMLARQAEPYLRARIVEGLEQHFHTRVELDSFHVEVRHGQEAEFGVWATGRGLRIWPQKQRNSETEKQRSGETEKQGSRETEKQGGGDGLEGEAGPLIALEEFSFHVPLRRYEAGKPVRIPEVKLKGLDVHVPPRSLASGTTGAQPQAGPGGERGGATGALGNVLVERVVCEQAQVVLETDQPGKLPLVFRVARLKLKHVKAGDPVEYDAQLVNAKPTGQIEAQGSFGPWEMGDPGMSPVKGKYTFQHANLGEFNGIAGILSSNGTYEGTLREITVDGETMTPDFKLTQFGTALPLHTRFHARVDGTNGDTYLDNVDATLGNSHFTTAGKVVRVKLEGAGEPETGVAFAPGQDAHPGHVIDMKVNVPRGNMADFLRLVSKNGTPLITGAVETNATLHIAPGQEPVHLRMKLDGLFKLEDARFTNGKFQDKVEELSYRGQGRPDAMKFADSKSVAWRMEGSFKVSDGVVTLPDLKYDVPGAEIDLAGTYALAGALHFDGTARMDATVSQMVGGWKGILLKPADRLFKKGGAGTLVAITVRGSREQPDFGVDLGKMNATHPERPGEKP